MSMHLHPLSDRLYDEAAHSGKHAGPRCRMPGGGSARGRKAGGLRNPGGDIVAAYVEGDKGRRLWIEYFKPGALLHVNPLSSGSGGARA